MGGYRIELGISPPSRCLEFRDDRILFAIETGRKFFPYASHEQLLGVAKNFASNFLPGYSPYRQEWELRQEGVGSGVCAEHYVAFIGYMLLDQEPRGLDEAEFAQIRHRCLSM